MLSSWSKSVALFLIHLLKTFISTVIVYLQTPRNWSPIWQLALNGFISGWSVIVFVLIQLRRNSSGSAHHVVLTCFLPVWSSIRHCNTAFSVRPESRSYRWQWSVIVSTCQPYHQHMLLRSASATTCSTISDHGCCSRSSSSTDSQPSRLLQQSACWSTYWPNITSTVTVSFTWGRSTCAPPAWSCSNVSSHAWHTPLVEFPAACHVQVMSADIQVSTRSGSRLPVVLLHVTDLRSWLSSVMFSWCKQTAGTMVLHDQIWTAFLRFFWSNCLEWYASSSVQPGLISEWL